MGHSQLIVIGLVLLFVAGLIILGFADRFVGSLMIGAAVGGLVVHVLSRLDKDED